MGFDAETSGRLARSTSSLQSGRYAGSRTSTRFATGKHPTRRSIGCWPPWTRCEARGRSSRAALGRHGRLLVDHVAAWPLPRVRRLGGGTHLGPLVRDGRRASRWRSHRRMGRQAPTHHRGAGSSVRGAYRHRRRNPSVFRGLRAVPQSAQGRRASTTCGWLPRRLPSRTPRPSLPATGPTSNASHRVPAGHHSSREDQARGRRRRRRPEP